MKTMWNVKTIGPSLPSFYIDRRLPDDDDYGLSLWKKETHTYKQWLDGKGEACVVYVSFGSLASLTRNQMEEIAWGLMDAGVPFLWVVRASEEGKLSDELVSAMSGEGKIVRWCSQLEVLAHPAVGCFVTHCGWNSTLEAISLGVPMVAVPRWSDQPTNAKYVEEVWGVGVRAREDGEGVIGREEVERCVREVMEGERGKEARRNALKWKELARLAMEEGGSSDNNIQDFVAAVLDRSFSKAKAP